MASPMLQKLLHKGLIKHPCYIRIRCCKVCLSSTKQACRLQQLSCTGKRACLMLLLLLLPLLPASVTCPLETSIQSNEANGTSAQYGCARATYVCRWHGVQGQPTYEGTYYVA